MKFKVYSLILFVSFLISMGCQRDDICPETTDTTPLLIIRFYDINDPAVPLAPQNLGIREENSEEFVFIRNDRNRDQVITYERFTGDSLAIPLKTDSDITSFKFILNNTEAALEDGTQDTDILTFTYGINEEYINRACAFKVNYVGLKVDAQEAEDNSRWIQDIQVEQANIVDQNQAHVSIFF
ncbi:DUF6452 family protein [Christiangramia sabulilitoris]|uniref:Uncharacterized protein n=1 Tax=Christiangramia sabulilitoris TaxID=2583991 RepID=A0A550HX79_9FLAO|nr:DUF6452 family protein [Christiangramia sabulilitoris]TRO63310.1 hypothetical protein FGM01_14300 [Christiangramia sabulilitoris]